MTATMAELYLKQGLYEEAIRVYERLLESSPGDFRLVEKLKAARLLSERGPAIGRRSAQSPARPPAPREEASGPEPAEQAATDDDIASEVEVADAPPAPQPDSEPEARRQTIRAYLESLLDAAGAQEGGLDPEASPRFEAWLRERDKERGGE
jgi:tetratricopeptide (TPR) repeat protein